MSTWRGSPPGGGWIILGALGVTLMFAGVACRPTTASRSNVVFIVVDTLRQDHLGCYGHTRDTTPSIDAFAAGATRFDRAYTPAPWTMPAVTSMFTGLYPSRHGVRKLETALPGSLLTLAEMLGEAGYSTAGVISHQLLDRAHGFDQGFQTYIEVLDDTHPHESISTDRVTDAARKTLAGLRNGSAPFFLFVHYFDPHYNYMRHAEHGFAPQSAGRLDGDETIGDLYDLLEDMTDEEIEFVKALYDEEIRHTDAGVGRLLEAVEDAGLLDDTLIILVSDHGEEFMAHGNIGHTVTLYEELVLVPLIVRPPGGGSPDRIAAPVSVVALTPTILDLLGVDAKGVAFQAGSLAPFLASRDAEPRQPVMFFETDQLVSKRAAIVGRHKIVRDENSGVIELFDLAEDPDELNDLSGNAADLAAKLLSVLEQSIASAGLEPFEAEPLALTEEQIEQLRSLGYLGRD